MTMMTEATATVDRTRDANVAGERSVLAEGLDVLPPFCTTGWEAYQRARQSL